MKRMGVFMEIITAFLFLLIGSVLDVKTRRLPLLYLLLFGCAGILALCFGTPRDPAVFFRALLPGLLLLVIGAATREGVGYGDGVVVLILGILLGARLCAGAVLAGLFLSALCSCLLLLFKRVNGKSRIPYIPFLTAGLGVITFVK